MTFPLECLELCIFQSAIGTWSVRLPAGLLELSIVAVTALSFPGQPPVFPSAMGRRFSFFQVWKGEEVERLHPPAPPKVAHTLRNVGTPGYQGFPVFYR